MKEIKLHYTEAFLRESVRARYLGALKDYRVWIGIVLWFGWQWYWTMPRELEKREWTLGVWAMVWPCIMLFYVFKFKSSMRRTVTAYREGEYEGWTLSYTEEHLTVSGKSFNRTTMWKDISKVARRPTYWVLTRPHSNILILPLDSLDAEDREFITRKTHTAISD